MSGCKYLIQGSQDRASLIVGPSVESIGRFKFHKYPLVDLLIE
jgi:hypothetical protein